LPFCLFGGRQRPARSLPDRSELERLSSYVPVAGRWHFHTSPQLSLAVSAPTQWAALKSVRGGAVDLSSTEFERHLQTGSVLFEGFLANRDELGDLLGRLPTRPENDAGWVAATIRELGMAALHRLKGNYVLCVVMQAGRAVYAARDRLGGRTAYYATSDKGFAVASRSALIAGTPEFGQDEDAEFLARWLALRSPPKPGSTVFSDISELYPGSVWQCVDGRVRCERHPFRIESLGSIRDPADAIAAFAGAFEASVAATLGDHGDVAVMLSGGMDSGPAAIVAQEHLAGRGERLLPVSWLLPETPRADESRWIRMLCDAMGIPLTEIIGAPDSSLSERGDAAVSPDLPAFNIYRSLVNACYERAAEIGCKVILNGNAGDALYPHPGLLLPDLLRRGEYRAFVQLTMHRLLRARMVRAHRDLFLRGATRHWRNRWKKRDPSMSPPAWLTAWAGEQLRELADWPPEADEHPFPEYARQLIGPSIAFGRAHEMAWCERFGIERRDPFHNEDLVQLMLKLPVSFSYRNGMDKWIMRAAMKGRMPDRFRLKRRTGLLHPLFHAGWNAHRQGLYHLLFEEQTEWQRYVRPEPVRLALGTPVAPSRRPDRRIMLVTAQCVGYALWRRFWAG